MEIVHGSLAPSAACVGLLPGAFNPPTVAHLALLRAARQVTDSVVLVVPRTYPHKTFEGAPLAERLEMLRRLDPELPYAVALADQGLLIDIAREFRRDILREADVHFVCGRDAAERITAWDYGSPGEIERQLREYKLLVAARQGEYSPPEELRHGIAPLPVETAEYDEVSSTMVRQMLANGHDAALWQPFVPQSIRELVQSIYGR